MTVHVKVSGVQHSDFDWEDRPISSIGQTATVLVEVTFTTDLAGGEFTISHPGIDATSFVVAPRKATGSKPLFGKRKVAPTDLTRVETLKCRVRFARETDAPQPFALTAVTNCATEANTEHKLRVFADLQTATASMVLVRVATASTGPSVLNLAKGGSTGPTSRHQNTAQAFTRFYAQFFFKDPEGVERAFPNGMPVKVMLGPHPMNAIDATIGADGKLAVEMIGAADVIAHKLLRVRFGAPDDNNFIICEAPGGTASQTIGPAPAPVDPDGNYDKRFFRLPAAWSMRQADWTVTGDDGRWKSDSHFEMTKDGRAASLGTAEAPVKAVLDPHWQFLRFEYFDRHFGHSDHGDATRSVSPMLITGDRVKPLVAGVFDEDTKSNWWLKVANDDVVQCLPWIVQRRLDGTADARPSTDTLLRFTAPTNACIESTSATARKRVVATAEQLKPGPERLKFYDLPTEWQSRNYYAKLSDTAGEFGWYEDVASKPTTKAKPLVFSLDDIVLTNAAGQRLTTWTHADRLAIFVNTFDDTIGGASKEGIYKPDAGAKLPWYTTKPAAGAPEENENYVIDRPGWVRMIAAKGNLFDVFDRRTVVSAPADPDYDVVGARAAVCWVDTTKQIGATTLGSFTGPGGAWAWSPDNVPQPGRKFFPDTPVRVDQAFMSVQPYYSQDYVERFGKYLDVGSTGGIGRFDMALLRCCSATVVEGKPVEVGVNVWFHRVCFDTTLAPAVGTVADYQVAFVRNILDRFNGLDAKNGQGRPLLLPKDPTRPLHVVQLSCMQVTPQSEAHFEITLTDSSKGARDWRSDRGTGETGNAAPEDSGTNNGFVNAHEHGHQSAFPDEYNERWDAASYGQPSFYSTLPGDPFEMDGRTKEFQKNNSPLMNGNHTFHNRYFWQAAEWVRLATRIGMKVKLGTRYKEYWLPPYPTAQETKRHYAFWPVTPSKNDITLVARGGLAANRAKLDLYLYALGADAFPIDVLPKKEVPPGTDPYDGLLMVTVRLKVNAWGVKKDEEDDLKALAHAIARVSRRFDSTKTRKLNHAWTIAGTHGKNTPQEWKFERCLVHLSPRLLISGVAELETVATVEGRANEFKDESIWTGWKQRLVDYHAIGWDDANKETRLDAVIGPMAEPVIPMRGGWNSTQPYLSDVSDALDDYENLGDDEVGDRFGAAEAVRDACDQALNDPAMAVNSRRGGVTSLRGRAETARKKLGALFYVRQMEENASDLKKRNKEQEDKVTEVATAHAPHFTVNCKAGTPAKAEWDPMPVEGDLPTAAAWANLVPSALRTGAVFNRVKGRIDAYHKKDALDIAARIKALGELLGPEVIAPEPSPRGDWTMHDKQSLREIDTQLTVFETTDAESIEARSLACSGAHAFAIICDQLELTDGRDKALADALLDRLELAMRQLQFRRQVRGIEAHARLFKEHLERWVASTTVTLTADSPDAFEEAMLMAFPSMFGAYRAASEITADDVKAFAEKLSLEGLKVNDLLDDGPPELPTN
jgi:hypothetical protein